MTSIKMKFKDLSGGSTFRDETGQLFVKQQITGVPVPKYMERWGNAVPVFERLTFQNDEIVTHCFYTDDGLQTGETMTFKELKIDRIFHAEDGSLYARRLREADGTNAIPHSDRVFVFADDDVVEFVEGGKSSEMWYFDEIR